METFVYECSICGGNLEFSAGQQSLRCRFCGTATQMEGDPHPEVLEELDFGSALRNLETSTTAVDVQNVTCGGCGAEVTLGVYETTGSCAYCGTQVVACGNAHKVLQPQYVLPFSITPADGGKLFKKWISSRRFAPNALRQYTRVSEPLTGVYYPFWTFDSATRSEYRGQRGIYYTETVRTRNSEGRMVTRTVTKTRWYPAKGMVSRNFDDVLVPASESLDGELVAKVQEFPLREMVRYDAQYLAGFRGESYSVELTDGFASAKSAMDLQIRADVKRDIGGDTQRITSLHTVHRDVTFKYVVLPIYALKYKFRKRYYPVLISGVTGSIAGKRPFSWVKIAATVAVVVVVGGFFVLRYFGVV